MDEEGAARRGQKDGGHPPEPPALERGFALVVLDVAAAPRLRALVEVLREIAQIASHRFAGHRLAMAGQQRLDAGRGEPLDRPARRVPVGREVGRRSVQLQPLRRDRDQRLLRVVVTASPAMTTPSAPRKSEMWPAVCPGV